MLGRGSLPGVLVVWLVVGGVPAPRSVLRPVLRTFHHRALAEEEAGSRAPQGPGGGKELGFAFKLTG